VDAGVSFLFRIGFEECLERRWWLFARLFVSRTAHSENSQYEVAIHQPIAFHLQIALEAGPVGLADPWAEDPARISDTRSDQRPHPCAKGNLG
jgi:hypothetical protein